MFTVHYSPAAQRDVREIIQYITVNLGNPIAAEKLLEEIQKTTEIMASFPFAFPLCEIKRPLRHQYRKAGARKYLILYWVDESQKKIRIFRVVHGSRDYRTILE